MRNLQEGLPESSPIPRREEERHEDVRRVDDAGFLEGNMAGKKHASRQPRYRRAASAARRMSPLQAIESRL